MNGPNVDFDDLMLRSWQSGASGPLGGVDWLTLAALAVVAVLYFLAPVAGYRSRGVLAASLWVFLGKMGLSLLRVCIVALELLDRPRMTGNSPRTMEAVLVLLSVVETGLFVLGAVLFVIGLSTLRRDTDLPRMPRSLRND